MKYSKVYVETIGYELPSVVVTSREIEARLDPFYQDLKLSRGLLEALTGIFERRWWPEEYRLSDGAVAAAKKSLDASGMAIEDVGALVYTGVCREYLEPATACRVAHALGVQENTAVYDISNACLGMLSGIFDMANRIELGQIKAGLIVSCESAREIVDLTIDRVRRSKDMALFKECLATLTGGSGAAAVLLSDGTVGGRGGRHALEGGVNLTNPEQHDLCRWGVSRKTGALHEEFMKTDAIGVLKHGVALGSRTWKVFLRNQGWTVSDVDKTICHQVASANQNAILKATGIAKEKDFTSYPFLGNMGTVSLPITAALAAERGFLQEGDRVAFLGIGSGLNCIMQGLVW